MAGVSKPGWSQMVERHGGRPSPEIRKLSKREIKIRLERGQVPAEPIFALIEGAGYTMSLLANARMVYRWRLTGYIPFSSADRVMTKAYMSMEWHSEPLKDIYMNVNLNVSPNCKPNKKGPLLHGDTLKYEKGCRCKACDIAWREGKGRRQKEREAAA